MEVEAVVPLWVAIPTPVGYPHPMGKPSYRGPDPICDAEVWIEGCNGVKVPLRCTLSAYHRRKHMAPLGLAWGSGKAQRLRWEGVGRLVGAR